MCVVINFVFVCVNYLKVVMKVFFVDDEVYNEMMFVVDFVLCDEIEIN